VGSGSPGTGSRLSGSGFEAIGQRSGGFGSHLEDSTSLWCWSYGMTLSFQTETQQNRSVTSGACNESSSSIFFMLSAISPPG
jgi:hypothetical protein